jgi:N-formylglutamate amidohydrolase
MDTPSETIAFDPDPYVIYRPTTVLAPVVFSSPHSGRFYPDDFVAASRLDRITLKSSEDSFVDELYQCVPRLGGVLIAAQYARAYCDPNREPYELDPNMFSGALPPQANTRSPRVAAGLGTIPKTVGGGAEIYRGKLSVAEIERRLGRSYRPYHEALRGLIDEARHHFGWSLLIDCHSMPPMAPPSGAAMAGLGDQGDWYANVVLGDCHGGACTGVITQVVEDKFRSLGYHVQRNAPYAGGFTTRHWGHPQTGSQALQIEISRALYMDAHGKTKGAGFTKMQADLEQVVAAIIKLASQGYCL